MADRGRGRGRLDVSGLSLNRMPDFGQRGAGRGLAIPTRADHTGRRKLPFPHPKSPSAAPGQKTDLLQMVDY
jgi:hypothetical protein